MRIALVIALMVGCSGAPAASYIEPNSRAPFKVVQLAIGRQHACALLDDGSVWCWGDNRLAQAPSGVPLPLTARRVDALGVASAIAAHGDRSCALVSGRLLCFGDNDDGALGVSSDATCEKRTPCVMTPTAVPGISDAIAIEMGGYGICVLRSDRSMWCLRRDPQSPATTTLVREVAGDGALDFALGATHVCVIRPDRRVLCFGRSSKYALGVHATLPVDAFVVPGVEGAVAIEAGADSTCALRDDGSLVCWGALAGTPIEGQPAPGCDISLRCTRKPIVAPGGPFASFSMTGQLETVYDGYGGVTASCTRNNAGELTCHDLPELPSSAELFRVGTYGVCGVVEDRVHCRGNGGFFGASSDAVRFLGSP